MRPQNWIDIAVDGLLIRPSCWLLGLICSRIVIFFCMSCEETLQCHVITAATHLKPFFFLFTKHCSSIFTNHLFTFFCCKRSFIHVMCNTSSKTFMDMYTPGISADYLRATNCCSSICPSTTPSNCSSTSLLWELLLIKIVPTYYLVFFIVNLSSLEMGFIAAFAVCFKLLALVFVLLCRFVRDH